MSVDDEEEEKGIFAKSKNSPDTGDDWMCQQCGFANPLNLEQCQICDTTRPKKEINIDIDVAKLVADAKWLVAHRRVPKVKLTKQIIKQLRQQKVESRKREELERDANRDIVYESDDEEGKAALVKKGRAEADLKALKKMAAMKKQDSPVKAIHIPFHKIVQVVATCEDIRGCAFTTRDTFINLSKTSGLGSGDIAFAIASFFSFGNIVQFVVESEDADAINKQWRECKSILEIRKYDLTRKPSGKSSEKANPILRKKKTKKRKVQMTKVESCVSSWEIFPRLHEATVSFLNLTGIPEKHHMYPKRPLSSDRWRPTLEDAISLVEDRLSLMSEGSIFILATRNALYAEAKSAAGSSNAKSQSKVKGTDQPESQMVSNHPIDIVGWKRLETFMHRHSGLVHEDADSNGIVVEEKSGKKYYCEPDVNDGVWVRLDVYLEKTAMRLTGMQNLWQ